MHRPTKEILMPNYLLAYRAPTDYTPGDPAATAAWQTFFEGLGTHIVDVGAPITTCSPLGECERATTVLAGYSTISADDLDHAIELAGACPALSDRGGIEVGEISPFNPIAS
jgi:hypothetical protein